MEFDETRRLCADAYLSGTLTFIDCPHGEGPVCRIGDWWFYFADKGESYPDAFKFLCDVGHEAALDQVASYLAEEMGCLFPDETEYYMAVMRGEDPACMPSNDGRRLPGRAKRARYVNGTSCGAAVFSFDGCHKAYVVDNAEGLASELQLGGNLFPIDMLPQAWAESCPLRFVSHADLRTPDLVAQGETASFDGFAMPPYVRAEVDSLNREIEEFVAEIEAEAEEG